MFAIFGFLCRLLLQISGDDLAGFYSTLLIFSLQIFVKDNQSGDETTQIDYLAIYGSPINVTNMSEFKRVRRV